MTPTLATFPPGTRVLAPGGTKGTVVRVSQSLRKWPILVRLDSGATRPYAPDELVLLATPGTMQSQVRPLP